MSGVDPIRRGTRLLWGARLLAGLVALWPALVAAQTNAQDEIGEEATAAARVAWEDKPYEVVDGKVDSGTYDGYRRYQSHCHVCHGPDGLGSSYAPALIESLAQIGYEGYLEAVMYGIENVSQVAAVGDAGVRRGRGGRQPRGRHLFLPEGARRWRDRSRPARAAAELAPVEENSMLWTNKLAAVAFALGLTCGAASGLAQMGELVDRDTLRVCADPNNLPFSNEAGEGFENKIAELLAEDLGVDLAYTWHPQVIGFVRNTLGRARLRPGDGDRHDQRGHAEHQSLLPLELRPGAARRCRYQGDLAQRPEARRSAHRRRGSDAADRRPGPAGAAEERHSRTS